MRREVNPKAMKLFSQTNRTLIVAGGAFVGIILYLNWTTLMQRQQEISIQKSLSETLKALKNMEAEGKNSKSNVEETKPEAKDKEKFSVAGRGFWQGLGAKKNHVFDSKLANAIIQFLKAEEVKTVLEFGSGTGSYAKLIKKEGIVINCYDGNPQTQILSEGRCAIIDLSKPLDFCKTDFVLSLEVGEHIPKDYEDIFISNLDMGNKRGIILSWAIEFQGGTSHVNNRNNSYIRNKLLTKGYNSDFEAEKKLRDAATMGWFKNTIMVFRRQLQ